MLEQRQLPGWICRGASGCFGRRARIHFRRDSGTAVHVRLSLVIPAFNEAERLPRCLDVLLSARGILAADEIVVVDDGSSDGTLVVARAAAARDARVRVVACERNRGKGAALRSGMAGTRGRFVLFTDADLSFDLPDLERVVACAEGGADVAIGARDLCDDGVVYPSRRRSVATRVFSALVQAGFGLGIPDTQCGLKAFRGDAGRTLFRALSVDRFGFDVELLWLARHWGLRIERVPVRMKWASGSSVRPVRDGARMAVDLARIRWRAAAGAYPERP